jgi:hypothetical protein
MVHADSAAVDGGVADPDQKFAYSLDQESYRGDFDTREDAIAAAGDDIDFVGEAIEFTVWTGRKTYVEFSTYSLGNWAIEHLQEEAYDEAGEFAMNWLENVSSEERDELGKAILKLVMAIEPPDFWTVEDVQEHPGQRVIREERDERR